MVCNYINFDLIASMASFIWEFGDIYRQSLVKKTNKKNIPSNKRESAKRTTTTKISSKSD